MVPLHDEDLKRAFQLLRSTDRRRAPDFEDVAGFSEIAGSGLSEGAPRTEASATGGVSTEEQDKQARRARRDLESLLAVPGAQRREAIERARSRYRSPTFVELLLEESRRAIRHDAKEALNLASLVPVAIQCMAEDTNPHWAFKIQALAAAHEANALRILGDLEGADRQIQDLRRRLARSPMLSSSELGEIANIEAALRFVQRRYAEAEVLVDRAARHYRLAENVRGLAQALIQKGNLYFHQGRFPAALTTYSEASPLLDPEEEPFLAECIVTGRVLTNCELGEFDDAQELLMTNRSLYESRDAYGTTQFRGLQGRIALGLEQWHDAEIAYSDCRDGHLATGRFHDATLASLDVARAMLQQGKLAEVTTMAAEILEIFKARGAEQEVLGAMVLIQEAAASRSLSLTLLAKARKRLEQRRS